MENNTKNEDKNPTPFKNRALLRVAVIYYNFFYGISTEPLRAVKMRLVEQKVHITNSAIAFEMTPADVLPFLDCGKKAAQECIDLLRLVML